MRASVPDPREKGEMNCRQTSKHPSTPNAPGDQRWIDEPDRLLERLDPFASLIVTEWIVRPLCTQAGASQSRASAIRGTARMISTAHL